ncbi:CapA family protein [Ferruginibacter paludis]|uniref:CapA family protein n=1 Tax=Ferruginibacter paludis TaxID=1310417 RepID=UPI0025B28DCA|nr:CapA family protein [Ferruginibacter paludis]MDN3656584.1 CapA family protein [Ferruginibacter paludis]
MLRHSFLRRILLTLLMMNDKLIIGLAGDVMIGRSVDPVISTEGYSYVWGNMLPLLRGTDLNIINLETTLTSSEKKVSKVFNFKAAPDKVKSLTEAHITFANLANNHILDYSEEGLKETLQVLHNADIQYTGAGMNQQEAERPCFFAKNNLRLGLLGYTDNEPGWSAGISKSGINYINVSAKKYRQKVLEAIVRVRTETDIVVVSMHWGPNMRQEPSDEFIAFAHDMVEMGADIIHGHSAHIFQGVEVYHNKLVLYDTGDFVDDYVADPILKNNLSFLFRIEMTGKGIEKLTLTPALIGNYQVNQATGKNYEWSIKRMQQLSVRFGTTVSDTGEVMIKSGRL